MARTTTKIKQISAKTWEQIELMRGIANESTYSYEQVKFLCNNIGPRLSGSPQAAAAIAYVSQQMRELGLDVRLEPVTVPHWVRGREEAELIHYAGQVDGTAQKIVVTALGNSVPTSEQGITASILVIDEFEQLERLPPDEVKGSVVLFNYRFDEFAARAGRWDEAYGAAVQYRNNGPARAAKKGAAATLVRSVGSGMFRLAHTGVTRYEDGQPRIPAAAVPAEDADLMADLAKEGAVTIHLVLTAQDLAPEQSYNIIADLKGKELSNQIVIVSGHLDSWDLGTGALDDATGVGVTMDVVRIIIKVCPHPRRTIRFVAWMNEENGGAGGRAYAEDHASQLRDHVAAIEIDYGDGRPLALNVAGTDERLAPIGDILHIISEPIGGIVRVSESPGVDVTAICEAGVPAIAPLQDGRHYFDYHHTAADTFDKVHIDEIRKIVEVITPLVYALAQHD
ncbi:MAG TPA: M28 family peptidase [Candidatus Acidoferrales bacterium]|nr:M28 family peptidase [Candidatus Acidoferrales bacterium]